MTRLAGSLAHARAESAEVRYATDAIVLVDGGDVADLKRAAEDNIIPTQPAETLFAAFSRSGFAETAYGDPLSSAEKP